MSNELKYISPVYGVVHAYRHTDIRRCADYVAVYFRLPIHLYNFIHFPPWRGDTERAAYITDPQVNNRFDFEWPLSEPLTPLRVDAKLGEEFEDAIETDDGIIGFYKIEGRR